MFPDFFKVGIAESGNHDNRIYEDDWDEKWGGLEVIANGQDNYETQAAQNYAKNLKGHLLLAHGTSDDNVPPNNTLVLVEALIKANKDFDLLLIPNAHHGYGEAAQYVMRRRWDYFTRNLAGGTPPELPDQAVRRGVSRAVWAGWKWTDGRELLRSFLTCHSRSESAFCTICRGRRVNADPLRG